MKKPTPTDSKNGTQAVACPVQGQAVRDGNLNCVSSQKQPALAWAIYADDNSGRVINFHAAQTRAEMSLGIFPSAPKIPLVAPGTLVQ